MARYDQQSYGRGDPSRNRPWGYGRESEDEHLQRAVRWSLFEDTWLDARDIDISVEDGVVTLTGEVRDHMSARYAWDDAWETPGVRGVVSRLEVREKQSTG